MQSFLSLTNDVLDLDGPERLLVQIFKMFLIFCKDSNANAFLVEQLKSQPALFLDFFLYGLHLSYINTAFQRYTLMSLAMVFNKAQGATEKGSLLRKLERYVLPLDDLIPTEEEDLVLNGLDDIVSMNKQLISICMQNQSSQTKDDDQNPDAGVKTTNAAVLIYHRLDRLFEQYYPPKTFHFLQKPGSGHVHICETLGLLLKLSRCAVHAAGQLKLLDRVVNLLDTFLNDENIGNAYAYVKRVGAHKSQNILSNLLLLINMLFQWHSSYNTLISKTSMAATLTRIIIRIWPWLSHSQHLKKITVQLTMFLTERSFEMCKQTSILHHGQSHSLLHLMVRVADFETTKKEAPNCLRFCQPQVKSGLSEALETDHHHSFHLMLHDRLIPLETLHLISQCLMHLLSNECFDVKMNWHGKFFMQLSKVARTHFELRQLQHVRCILRILRRLSERDLKFSDVQLTVSTESN